MSNIGVDSWVAESGERDRRYTGWGGPARRLLDRIPSGWKLLAFLVVVGIYPFFASPSGVRIGITALLLAMLAIGLNVVVGWAGMLDLGYIAFYGFGAYFYAVVSSDQIGVMWPTWVSVPVIVAASALLGALLSLPSRRLVGDYLAIMTLFFAQIFLELIVNFQRLPGVSVDLTGGPNGVIGVRPWELFGFSFNTFNRNFYLLLVLLGVIVVLLRNIDGSRTGRAWRALREDTLAAAHMTTPVNNLKMLAFAVGAGVAGLTGTILGPVQVGVFPNNFQLLFLITMYAAVILGGLGSIPGVVLGALVVAFTPEILRNPNAAGWLFYLGLVGLLIAMLRKPAQIAAVAVGLVAFGYLVRFASLAVWGEVILGMPNDAFLSTLVDDWMLILGPARDVASNYAFVLAIAGVLGVIVTKGWWRLALLIPTVYLSIFVWENKLALKPSITRQLLFGGVLVVMMAVRPQGLLGTRRVQIT
ncbi:MAG TPA: branched-chain amino acid ABC transporter permease [Acidimicrobiia bacterium]